MTTDDLIERAAKVIDPIAFEPANTPSVGDTSYQAKMHTLLARQRNARERAEELRVRGLLHASDDDGSWIVRQQQDTIVRLLQRLGGCTTFTVKELVADDVPRQWSAWTDIDGGVTVALGPPDGAASAAQPSTPTTASTDPRALLDAYARELPAFGIMGPREQPAPKAFAALRAVIDLCDNAEIGSYGAVTVNVDQIEQVITRALTE